MKVVVAVIAFGLSSIACGAMDVRPASPSPLPAIATPVAVASSGVPTASSPTVGWGPLAVVPPQDGADTARTEGTLRITDECVVLDTAGGPVVLVWPADRTAWNAEARTIGFTNFDGSTVSIGDGMAVIVGGSGDRVGEGGATINAWLAQTPWVARPAETCPLESWWAVGAIGG